MTARVIPIAVSGDHDTSLPADRECGCSPLDGCCLPQRPKLVTVSEEQQDDPPVATVSDGASAVEFPQFRLKSLDELIWFKTFLHTIRQQEPHGDLYVAIEEAVRRVENHRDMIAGLVEGREDIKDAIENQDWRYANEIIEEFFPVDEYPDAEELPSADAPKFFDLLIELHTANPLATIAEVFEKALKLVLCCTDAEIHVAAFNEDIDCDVKVMGEEATLEALDKAYAANSATADLDFSDFTIDEFKTFNIRLAELEESMEEGTSLQVLAEDAHEDVIAAREPNGTVQYPTPEDFANESIDAVCDCREGECVVADVTEDLSHFAVIIYTFPLGSDDEYELEIENPVSRVIYEDGTQVILDADDVVTEVGAGWVSLTMFPKFDVDPLAHIEF